MIDLARLRQLCQRALDEPDRIKQRAILLEILELLRQEQVGIKQRIRPHIENYLEHLDYKLRVLRTAQDQGEFGGMF